jgi:hypothetical protein
MYNISICLEQLSKATEILSRASWFPRRLNVHLANAYLESYHYSNPVSLDTVDLWVPTTQILLFSISDVSYVPRLSPSARYSMLQTASV